MEVKEWSLLGRLRDTVFKFISAKGVIMIVVLVATIAGKIDAMAGLGFVAVALGIREFGKVKGVELFKKE